MASQGASVWASARDIIKKEVDNDQTFNIWFAPIKCVSVSSEKITLEVPNSFSKGWLVERYMGVLSSAVTRAAGGELAIDFVLSKDEPPDAAAASSGGAPPDEAAPAEAAKKLSKKDAKGFWPFARQVPDNAREIGLDDKYTFDTFVIGPSNRFAHAAALAVADSPAKAYNPLFIYGGTGLGKTHLMHAIGGRALARSPKAKVLYITSEDFTNQLIGAIQNRTMLKFKERYRSVDVLLIDDVQFIAGKDATQEEFFHTFNTLHDAHKQIVVTSDRPPKEIQKLEERLVSRFLYGLVTDIQPPDFETRIAILKKKSERAGVALPEEVFYFLAEKIRTNIRELEGALMRVVASASLVGKEVTVDLAKELLKDMIIEGQKKISVDLIQRKVSEYFDIKPSDMRAKKRSKAVAYPRQIAMYLTRQLTKYSLPEIGGQFGGRDHTTVIHACDKIETDLKNKEGLRALVDRLIANIRE
jgi:chromosomal replication initiator protein